MFSDAGNPKGVLKLEESRSKMHLALRPPSGALASFIEHFWFVTWDLRGQDPHVQENLPHPCVHLVTENGRALLYGVVTAKFVYRLEDRGRVFGIKFHPGAFHSFVKDTVSRLTDRQFEPFELFGFDASELERGNLAGADEAAMISVAERLLLAQAPVASAERAVIRAVVKRYRLVEAADEIARGKVVDWARLAVDLGYYDQAHFIRDFKGLIGFTPAEYAHSIQR